MTIKEGLSLGSKGIKHENNSTGFWSTNDSGKVISSCALGILAIAAGFKPIVDGIPESTPKVIQHLYSVFPDTKECNIRAFDKEGRLKETRNMITQIWCFEKQKMSIKEIGEAVETLLASENKQVLF